jgi:glutathionyl-hydroquinone reductase
LDVEWPKGKTIKGVVETILDQRKQSDELDLVDQNIRTLLLNGVKKVTDKINAGIVKAKSLELNQEDVDNQVESILESIVLEHTKKVFELCSKQ